MKSLKALSTHLLNTKRFDVDQFESFADNIELQYRNEPKTVGGNEVTQLYDLSYDAVILIDDFTEGAAQLFSELMLWLSQQDYDFDEHGNPQVNVDPMSDEKHNLEIVVHFNDPCFIQWLPDGGYTVVDGFELWTAETLAGVHVTKACGGGT